MSGEAGVITQDRYVLPTLTAPAVTRRRQPILPPLEKAAASGDRQTFVRLLNDIGWVAPQPEELIRAIDLALALELVPLAGELAQRGGRLFPQNQHLQQAAKVLAPPVVVGTRPAQERDGQASRDWLAKHSYEYRGRWVAVNNGAFLASSSSLKALYQQIGPIRSCPGDRRRECAAMITHFGWLLIEGGFAGVCLLR